MQGMNKSTIRACTKATIGFAVAWAGAACGKLDRQANPSLDSHRDDSAMTVKIAETAYRAATHDTESLRVLGFRKEPRATIIDLFPTGNAVGGGAQIRVDSVGRATVTKLHQ